MANSLESDSTKFRLDPSVGWWTIEVWAILLDSSCFIRIIILSFPKFTTAIIYHLSKNFLFLSRLRWIRPRYSEIVQTVRGSSSKRFRISQTYQGLILLLSSRVSKTNQGVSFAPSTVLDPIKTNVRLAIESNLIATLWGCCSLLALDLWVRSRWLLLVETVIRQ